MLLHLCRTATERDTDVLECATAAIANMTSMFEPNCVRLARSGGVEVLAGKGRRVMMCLINIA